MPEIIWALTVIAGLVLIGAAVTIGRNEYAAIWRVASSWKFIAVAGVAAACATVLYVSRIEQDRVPTPIRVEIKPPSSGSP